MPAATQAAGALVVEQVVVEPYVPGQEIVIWVKALPPEKRHQLAHRLGVLVGLLVGLAGVAMGEKAAQIAGGLLALASAVYAIYLFVIETNTEGHN